MLAIALPTLYFTATSTIRIYNALIDKHTATEKTWWDIDVQLQLRYDLIPNLVDTVKGYASHEKETLERVTQARNLARDAQDRGHKVQAANMLTGAIKTLLFAVSEAYPNLQADQSFMSLQRQLTAIEKEIAFARQRYNDVVGAYHTALRRFPNNLVGGIWRFREVEFFQLEDTERDKVRKGPYAKFSQRGDESSSIEAQRPDRLFRVLLEVLCCLMVSDGRASRSEKKCIHDLMAKVLSPWSDSELDERIAEFIHRVQTDGYRKTLAIVLKEVKVFKRVGKQELLLQCLDAVAKADGMLADKELQLIQRIRAIVE